MKQHVSETKWVMWPNLWRTWQGPQGATWSQAAEWQGQHSECPPACPLIASGASCQFLSLFKKTHKLGQRGGWQSTRGGRGSNCGGIMTSLQLLLSGGGQQPAGCASGSTFFRTVPGPNAILILRIYKCIVHL